MTPRTTTAGTAPSRSPRRGATASSCGPGSTPSPVGAISSARAPRRARTCRPTWRKVRTARGGGRRAAGERACHSRPRRIPRSPSAGLESEVPAEVALWLSCRRAESRPGPGPALGAPGLGARPVGRPGHDDPLEDLPRLAERARARFSTWYEMFPRSAASGTSHGTLADVAGPPDYVERMGFDVLYLPPIHPIGRTARKGRDQPPMPARTTWAAPGPSARSRGAYGDPSRSRNVRRFRSPGGDAAGRGIEVALDLAFQASPDHPWVRNIRRGSGTARRHDPLRREPAQEVRGHLPLRLRVRGLAGLVDGAARRRPFLDRSGRAHLQGRQPAHEAVRLLGVVDRLRATPRCPT